MGQFFVAFAVFQQHGRVTAHLQRLAVYQGFFLQKFQGLPRLQPFAPAQVQVGPQLLFPERDPFPVGNGAQTFGVEKQTVPLFEPQLHGAVGDALIHPQRRVDRRVQPFIAVLVAHLQRLDFAGIHIVEHAVCRAQGAHQGVEGKLAAQIEQLGVDIGHGLGQGTALAQAAADRGLGHHHIQRFGHAAPGHLADDQAHQAGVDVKIIVKGAAICRPPFQPALDLEAAPAGQVGQHLGQGRVADVVSHAALGVFGRFGRRHAARQLDLAVHFLQNAGHGLGKGPGLALLSRLLAQLFQGLGLGPLLQRLFQLFQGLCLPLHPVEPPGRGACPTGGRCQRQRQQAAKAGAGGHGHLHQPQDKGQQQPPA